ncbi:MAG: hypothetical protein WCK63_14470 [Betaproteobacteria bacterium]
MPKQQYTWLLALSMIVSQQENDDDQGKPISTEMRDVTGVAGQLRHHNHQAANELMAALFIYLLLFVLSSAINCAKYGNSGSLFCKLTHRRFFLPLPYIVLQMGDVANLALLLSSDKTITSPQ